MIDKALSMTAVDGDGNTYSIDSVAAYNKAQDIAILHCSALSGKPGLTMGDSDTIKLGQSVVAIGNPLGLQNAASTGIVSSLPSTDRGADLYDIHFSAPISHGNSGGNVGTVLSFYTQSG